METIKARPTTYKGIQMRSRLEAGYAAFLDSQPDSPTWEYEPRAFANEDGQYLPDFVVKEIVYVEVKPNSERDLDGVLRRMHIIQDTHPDAWLAVAVGSWDDGKYSWHVARACNPEVPCTECGPRDGATLAMPLWSWEGAHHEMSCPICDSWCTHLEKAEPYAGVENRPAVRLTFSCELGDHGFVIDITNHKGTTQARTTATRSEG